MRSTPLGIVILGLVALACAGDGSAGPPGATPLALPTEPPRLTNAPSFLDIPTYDGTGQAVHPDVVAFPDGWHGHPYWMAMTPYPYDTAERENPSVLVSGDGVGWETPGGLTNPLVGTPRCDHNSDPDIVYSPNADELYLFYTEVLRSRFCGAGTNVNRVKLMTSSDGVDWSEPQTVLEFDLDSAPVYVSPSIVYRNGRFEMWMASNADTLVYTTSADGVKWGPLREASIPEPPWHVDVNYVESKGEYWMLYVDSPVGGANLKFARSSDGIDWRVCSEPVLQPSSSWDNERIYRASFLYDDARAALRVWYSARSDEGEWRIGYAEGSHPGLAGYPC